MAAKPKKKKKKIHKTVTPAWQVAIDKNMKSRKKKKK